MIKKNTPKYKHDSDCCLFVKHDLDDLDFGEGRRYADIYVCNGVVIYRYSDEPSDNRAVGMDLYLERGFENKLITEDKEIMECYFSFNK